MTSVTDITAQAAARAAQSTASAKLSGDFDMFLKLLTTQMQHQDPLDPMDTAEYTQQLVQYSQVEQTIEQTATLKDMLAGLSAQTMAQAAGFIGREVEVGSALSGLTADAPAHWGYAAARTPASLVATIRDSSGRTVDTRPLDAGGARGRLVWDGLLADGTRAPAGTYALDVAAADADGQAVAVAVSSIGAVREVRSAGGTVALSINGADLPLAGLARVATGD